MPCLSYVKQQVRKSPPFRSTDREELKRKLSLVHSIADGKKVLLCVGDRGSLKDTVSRGVKRVSLCVWGEGLNVAFVSWPLGILCQSDDEGELFRFLLSATLLHCGHKVSILNIWGSFYFLMGVVGYWGICCLCRLWYGCVGEEGRQTGGGQWRHEISHQPWSCSLHVLSLTTSLQS